jgi:hypothetical protein
LTQSDEEILNVDLPTPKLQKEKKNEKKKTAST